MIYLYSQLQQGKHWLQQHTGCSPTFACILGFTATGLIPGISAAGATAKDREYTAIADAEFLASGVQKNYQYPLPILTAGASPTFISRAIIEALDIPLYLFNAGLRHQPTVKTIDLQGSPANCLSSGMAMDLTTVKHLFACGRDWGYKLAKKGDYLIIGECVVGGTTTALGVLTALGIGARGKVNSSHPHCNHRQKWSLVSEGLQRANLLKTEKGKIDPFSAISAVGDPMQAVAAGMAIAASESGGVLLAGGTQMLAVYALIRAILDCNDFAAKTKNIAIGTTRWVAEDPTGDTVGLANAIGQVPLFATGLSFNTSRYPCFRAYSQGYVKEGVGAGGCAISAHLQQGWTSTRLLTVIETLFADYRDLRMDSVS